MGGVEKLCRRCGLTRFLGSLSVSSPTSEAVPSSFRAAKSGGTREIAVESSLSELPWNRAE